jgi:enoyl-CoA hydratase
VSASKQKYETLAVEQMDRICVVTLNRPEKRNAISPTLQRELIDAVERCAADPSAHVVVIRGAGPSFCAGYDLGAAARGDVEGPDHDADGSGAAIVGSGRAIGTLDMARGWSRIWNAHIPTIAQIHGHCLAGGTDLAQHCDLIITAEDAIIGYAAVRMGGTPPVNMWLYNVGPQWAKRCLFTGDTFTGGLAAEIGFALQAVPADELDSHVLALAGRIAAMGRDIVAINKLVINKGLDLMGRAVLQEFAAPMDSIANQSPEMARFSTRAREIGLAAAFRERDELFGDDAPMDTVR